MAGNEAKVRVKLDTRPAKADLRNLTRDAASVAGRVGSNVRGAVGRGLGIVGLGGGVGLGMAALRGSTSAGFGDIIGETLGPIGESISDFLLGDNPANARAAMTARRQAREAFKWEAGSNGGKISDAARSLYGTIRAQEEVKERGRKVFRMDPDMRGPDIGDVVDRIVSGIGAELTKAVDYLASKIKFW